MSQDWHRVSLSLRWEKLRASVHPQPRENEIRVLERDGRRWLEQWRIPFGGQRHERAWVEVAELRAAGT